MIKEVYKIKDINKYKYAYFVEVQSTFSVVITKIDKIVFYNIRINMNKSKK